jgi:hypothetical protein
VPIDGTVPHHRATQTAAGEAECEGGNWMHLAQDRAFVNMGKNTASSLRGLEFIERLDGYVTDCLA